ncbi:hypothetical protein KC929_02360 [Patescibacteria group bacterium]|nr:hypothetical protein [Patescibacteria group bacterium]
MDIEKAVSNFTDILNKFNPAVGIRYTYGKLETKKPNQTCHVFLVIGKPTMKVVSSDDDREFAEILFKSVSKSRHRIFLQQLNANRKISEYDFGKLYTQLEQLDLPEY